MMTDTALSQAELKAAAGIKATGRKLENPVLAYSLSWHPSEDPDRAIMVKAAYETLAVLGLTKHQAVLVAHNDTDHAHVHILVNMVSPIDGRAASLSNSKLKLSKWAQAWELEHGQVFCQDRVTNNEKRDQGEFVHSPRVPRNIYEQRRAQQDKGAVIAALRQQQKNKDATLSQAGRMMHKRHAGQWAALKAGYQGQKDSLYQDRERQVQAVIAAIKAERKSEWASLFSDQRGQSQLFEARERSVLGKIRNMFETGWRLRRDADMAFKGNALGMMMAVMFKEERLDALAKEQDLARRKLATSVSRQIGSNLKSIRTRTRKQVDEARVVYLESCRKLKEEQGIERAEMQKAWRRRNVERRQAWQQAREEKPDIYQQALLARAQRARASSQRLKDRGLER